MRDIKILFPDKLERLQYFMRLLINFVSVAVMFFCSVPLANFIGIPAWLPLIITIPLVLLRFPCLDIPRFRSMGWSPWLVLLFLVPLVNCIMQLLLLFVPPRNDAALPPPLPGIRSPDWMTQNWKWFIPLLCLAALICLGGFMVFFENLMKSSEAYSGALARAESSPAVIAALGTPIKDGFFVSGNISENNSWGTANLAFPISGPKGAAKVFVSASKSHDKWHFDALVVQIDKPQQQIDILATNPLPETMPIQK